jgi:hypothetical protein
MASGSIIGASAFLEAVKKHKITYRPEPEYSDMDLLRLASALLWINLEINNDLCKPETFPT